MIVSALQTITDAFATTLNTDLVASISSALPIIAPLLVLVIGIPLVVGFVSRLSKKK